MRFYFEPPAPRKAKSTLRRLLVRCPSTAKLAPIGEPVEEATWASATKKSGRFTCPHCNRVHSWAKKDVLLAR